MTGKKIIHELSEDDLIALALGAKKDLIMDKISHAAKFIYDLGIKNGDTKISAQMIYHHYKDWRGWDVKHQSKAYFSRDFSKYFEPHRDNQGIYYLLNPKPFDLSQENVWLARKQQREAKAKRQKKPTK